MDTILEQNAIDQLFTMRQTARENDASAPVPSYNFGRAGRIGSEQMRAISVVNEQFARNLTHTLGAWLRTQLQVAAAAGEQMSFGDFLSCLPEPSYVCLLRLEPLGGVGLLEMSLSVAMTMVDLLLGGRGVTSVVREVTDIEDAILAAVLQVVMRELNTAWKPVGLQFELEKQETQASVARLMPASEQTLCVSLDVQMPGGQGLINFCLPAMVLNTLHRRLSAASDEPRKRFSPPSPRVGKLMGDAVVPLVVRLPLAKIASRVLKALQPGTVLELGLPKTTMAELLAGGVPMCAVLPVSRGERVCAQLQEESADKSPEACFDMAALHESGVSEKEAAAV
jgi:flagellar motor switch protein FliM